MSDEQFAPEIRTGQPHDQAADIWAFGQIIYKLLFALDNTEAILTLDENTSEISAEEEQDNLMSSCGNTNWQTNDNTELKQLVSRMVLTNP